MIIVNVNIVSIYDLQYISRVVYYTNYGFMKLKRPEYLLQAVSGLRNK